MAKITFKGNAVNTSGELPSVGSTAPEFALVKTDYGVLMTDGPLKGLLARSVVVLDKDGKVAYTELVEEVTNEPNYDAAIKAVK